MNDPEVTLPSRAWTYGRVEQASVMQVIRVHHVKGKGVEGDVVRPAYAYFTLDGEKLWEDDPHA